MRREDAWVLASVGAGPRTLYFSGHYDVVPAQSRDQFQPRVEGCKSVRSRSSDMKSGLPAMIHAAAAEGFPLRPPLFAADRVALDVHGDVAFAEHERMVLFLSTQRAFLKTDAVE